MEKKKSLKELIEEKRRETQERILSSSLPIEFKKEVSLKEKSVEAPINPTTPTKQKILDILKAKREKKEEKKEEKNGEAMQPHETKETKEISISPSENSPSEKKETFSLSIILNKEQEMAKDLAFSGKSFCLVGAAGTGKTTAQREVAKSLLKSGKLSQHEFRIQGTGQKISSHSIAFVAYTRVASGNLRRAIHKDSELEKELLHNITTVHNLLEYAPATIYDEILQKETFRFIPKRTASNPLTLTHLVIEEASMLGLDLWNELFSALPRNVQIIFIGDINQLPPVFGDSILNYSLTQLPVIELKEVFRQSEDSGILFNAHRILKGENVIEKEDFRILRCGTTNHTAGKLSIALGKELFPKWKERGEYDPIQDIILSPWNKRDLGTDNLNKWIAQSLGVERNATVFEVIAGISKLYLAVGDKVMVNKQVGVITKIVRNGKYMGASPKKESIHLTRFGSYSSAIEQEEFLEEEGNFNHIDIDKILDEEAEDSSMKMKEASHLVDISLDDGIDITLSKTGEFSSSSFSLAYALTVHKAQGCEWRRVFFILHRDHAISLSRELLYTGVTRAREKLILIAKDEVIEKAIKNQRIKGNSIQEKIEFFNSGIKLNNAVKIIK